MPRTALELLNLSTIKTYEDTTLTLAEVMQNYCTQIDGFIGYIFILSLMYIIIEYFLIERLRILANKLYQENPILFGVDKESLDSFFVYLNMGSRLVMALLSATGLYLWGSQINWSFSFFQWFLMGFTAFILIGGFIMQYYEGRK